MSNLVEELISIVEEVKNKVTDDSDIAWTVFNSPAEMRAELDDFVNHFKNGDFSGLYRLPLRFAPTVTIQEHSISNGWRPEYIALSSRFDKVYEEMKFRKIFTF